MENNNSTLFGSYIRLKREEKGLSIRKMASILDISPIYLCSIELGKRKPPVNNNLLLIYRIISVLSLSEEESNYAVDLAYASYGKISDEITSYLFSNDSAMEFLKMASELNLSNDFWTNLSNFISTSKGPKVYMYKKHNEEK